MRKEILKEINSYYEELKSIDIKKVNRDANFISVDSYDCYLNNGKVIKREKILKNGKDGSASIILPITEDNEIVLAIEPRVFTKNTVDIGFPAGYIEKDELPLNAARRELLEETGYDSCQFTYVGSFYQDQGCSAANNYYYIAENCKKVYNQQLDDGEFIKYILVNYDELMWLYENGYITGLNSAYLIESAKTRLRK